MDLQLLGKRAIVTGASRGIGKAIAFELAREGCDLAIAARNQGPLREAAAEIGNATGRRVFPLTCDVRDGAMIDEFVAKSAEALGGIDILINNAARTGTGGDEDSFEKVSADQVVADFEEKVVGYLRCARAASPFMKQAGWGRIINLSGGAGRVRGALIGAGTRNAAAKQLTISLANALGEYGINVVCVSPGGAVTEDRMARYVEQAARRGQTPEQYLDSLADNTLIRHMVTAEDVAHVVAFLCSPLAISITGQNIDVNGGTSPDVIYRRS